MALETWLAFALATAILILIPGPTVAVIVANSLTRGRGAGLAVVAGSSLAQALHLAAFALGMAAILAALSQMFELLRWLGVGYLLYLGWRAWTDHAPLETEAAAAGGVRAIFLQGFVVTLTNPKTLLFYAAFFPQFMDAGAPPGPQLAVMSATFLGVAAALDAAWALTAGAARPALRRIGRWRGRLTGAFFFLASAGLALARKP